jgi:osmotically-inducible protein OsmY
MVGDQAPKDEPAEYLVEHIRARLADDPGVAELGIAVAVHGQRVFLNGCIHTDEHRDAIVAVARKVAAGYEVHDDLTVCTPLEPPGEELLR